MPKSYYLDNNMLNATLRGIAFTPPVAVYLALYLVSPGVNSPGTEVTGGGYARQLVAFTAPVNGVSANAVDINFPVATANQGTVVALAVVDAASGGNVLYFGDLGSPRTVEASDQVRFPAGGLTAQET